MSLKVAWFWVCFVVAVILIVIVANSTSKSLISEGNFGFSENAIRRGSVKTIGQNYNGYQRVLILGRASVSTLEYIGTADGCSAVIYSVSTTAPTYNATSTAFCNP